MIRKVRSTRPDELHLEAWRSFFKTHARLMARLEHDLEVKHDISLPVYEVLFNLSRAPQGRLRHQELVQCARMTKSGISRLVDRMESAGLIRTERCPSDGRGAFAVLTATGKQRFRRAAATHLHGIQEYFGRHLTPDEAETLRGAMGRIGTGLAATEATPAWLDAPGATG